MDRTQLKFHESAAKKNEAMATLAQEELISMYLFHSLISCNDALRCTHAENVGGTAAVVVAAVVEVWPQGAKIGSWDLDECVSVVLGVKSSKEAIYPLLCGIEKVTAKGKTDWKVFKVLLQQLYKKATGTSDKQETD